LVLGAKLEQVVAQVEVEHGAKQLAPVEKGVDEQWVLHLVLVQALDVEFALLFC
jgi:hypothetical protein